MKTTQFPKEDTVKIHRNKHQAFYCWSPTFP